MILGIDAGGTSTSFVVYDEAGEIVLTHKDKTMHFMTVGFDGITQRLTDFLNVLKDKEIKAEDLFVVIGMAGYGEDLKIREKIEASVFKVFPQAIIMNDAHFAHISALNNQDGVLVISGTGSIAFHKKNNEFSRKGGFGYLIDDGGSGFWIGKQILRTFSRQIDGQIPKTRLYFEMKDQLKLSNDYDIIALVSGLGNEYRNWVADLAGMMSDVNDKYLENIYQSAGVELANMVNSIDVHETTNVAVYGSVLKHNSLVYESFNDNLKDAFKIVNQSHDVEYAAYLLYKENN